MKREGGGSSMSHIFIQAFNCSTIVTSYHLALSSGYREKRRYLAEVRGHHRKHGGSQESGGGVEGGEENDHSVLSIWVKRPVNAVRDPRVLCCRVNCRFVSLDWDKNDQFHGETTETDAIALHPPSVFCVSIRSSPHFIAIYAYRPEIK